MRRLISRIVALSVIAILPLVLTLARAQQPKAAPTSGIPEKAPPGWKQSDWTILRDRCLKLSAEWRRRQHMTPAQLNSLPPLNHSDVEMCLHMVVPPMRTVPHPPGKSIRMPPPPPPTSSNPNASADTLAAAPSGSSLGPFFQQPGAALA